MVQLIFSALGVFISTSIDYLILLVILFAQKNHKKRQWQIFAGQYLGTAFLIMLSLFAVYFVHFIPEDWIIGLLGLIPIYLGIRFFFSDEEENLEKYEKRIVPPVFILLGLYILIENGTLPFSNKVFKLPVQG